MFDKKKNTRKTAKLIWDCWQNGKTIVQLPEDLRPTTQEEGYAIQAHFEEFTTSPLFGWKIAATSPAGQSHIGVSTPLAGRLLSERVFEGESILNFGANRMAVAEPEFAFRFGEALKPKANGYSQSEVMSAVDTMHPGIEIPDSRFQNFAHVGEENLIADNACAHEFVIGPAMPSGWRSLDLSNHPVKISTKNGTTHHGSGTNVLGDPRIALTWLVNHLCQSKITLETGTTVTTGTCTKPIPIQRGDQIIADYGFLGQLEVILSPDKSAPLS